MADAVDEVLLTSEIVLGTLILLLAVFLVVTLIRRRLIAGSGVVTLCALRGRDTRWRSGLLRMTAEHLQWYPLFGITPCPRHVWERADIEVEGSGTAESADARSAVVGMAAPVQVSFSTDGGRRASRFQLVLSSGAYTALRAWLEAAPPTDRRFEA